MRAHPQTMPTRERVSVQRDARLIVTMRGCRSFAYGMLAVILGVVLTSEGFSAGAIGGLITVSLVGDLVGTYLISLVADSLGRRRTLLILAVLMAATGAIFASTSSYGVLLVAAFFGTLGTSASETAPFLPIEQAMLPQVSQAVERTALFAHYNLVATFAGAGGSLVAAVPDLLLRVGVSHTVGFRLLFGVYVGAALITALLSLRLSSTVEAATSSVPHTAGVLQRVVPPLGNARGVILRLTALFSVDALSGGLVVQSLLVLFFHLRFGVSLSMLAVLFFGANLFSALSFLAAPPLARRFGLLNTMVFTHLPSNLLLALVAFMPTFPLAAAFLLMRQMLSQMDVPTRQAYTMALVPPEARTATASVTSLARSGGSAISPVVAGVLLQGPGVALGLPLVLAGAIKVVYDLSLWAIFRRVTLAEE